MKVHTEFYRNETLLVDLETSTVEVVKPQRRWYDWRYLLTKSLTYGKRKLQGGIKWSLSDYPPSSSLTSNPY